MSKTNQLWNASYMYIPENHNTMAFYIIIQRGIGRGVVGLNSPHSQGRPRKVVMCCLTNKALSFKYSEWNSETGKSEIWRKGVANSEIWRI